MRLLVVGAAGLLGSNVVETALRRDWDVSGTYHTTRPSFDVPLTEFDLREHGRSGELVRAHDPDVVVNCAAMTDVDACETEPERARSINADSPGELARHCHAEGITFVQVSTDYVFDGDGDGPYGEGASPNPRQVYGESKLAGERAVRTAAANPLVPRLSFVWGVHRNEDGLAGFPAWVLDRLASSDEVPLFTDQWVTPTRAGHAADAILDLVERGASGRYHVASSSCVTPFEFGELLGDRVSVESTRLATASLQDVDRPASRPRRSCLRVAKVERELGRPQPTLAEDLDAVEPLQRHI